MVSKYGSNNGLNGNRRQRERTTFDPQEEITRLMQIFEKTHHPTRYQIAAICESLNSLACRKDKKPLEPYNIQYWFKNARAALRRKVKTESKEDNMFESLNNKTSLNKVNNHDENSKCSNYEDDDEDDLDNTMDENDEKNNFDIKAILSQPIQPNSAQNTKSLFNLNEKDKANKGNNKSYQLSHSNRSRSSSVNNDLDSLNEDEYNGVKNEDTEEPFGSANSNNTSRPSSSYNKSNNSKQLNNNYSNTNGKSKGSSSKRNRVFIDPISEVPILEHYFSIETYPDHYLIEKICDNLNKGEYRYKFPKLESRNIQLWFKNHRAKLKRLKSSNNTNENDTSNLNANSSMQHIDNCNDDYSLNDDDDELSPNHNHNNIQQEQQEDEDYENYDDGNYNEEPDDFDDAYDNQDDNKYANHQQRSLKCESGNWVELGKPAAHLGFKFKGRFIVFSFIFQVKSNTSNRGPKLNFFYLLFYSISFSHYSISQILLQLVNFKPFFYLLSFFFVIVVVLVGSLNPSIIENIWIIQTDFCRNFFQVFFDFLFSFIYHFLISNFIKFLLKATVLLERKKAVLFLFPFF